MDMPLRITAKGQVTLKKSVLKHLGVQPGQNVIAELKPGGVISLRPAPTGDISDAFGCLPRPEGEALTIEEMNEIIAAGWAGER